jgi:hypothetical protein
MTVVGIAHRYGWTSGSGAGAGNGSNGAFECRVVMVSIPSIGVRRSWLESGWGLLFRQVHIVGIE